MKFFARVELASLYYYVTLDYFQVAILHPSNLQEPLKKSETRTAGAWNHKILLMIKKLDMEDPDTEKEKKQLRHLGLSLLRSVTAAKYYWDS